MESITEKIRLAEQDDFKKALRYLRTTAKENGLTQEALEILLSEED